LVSSAVSEQEQIYIGLIQLTGKIIDNFDISFSEKIVEQKNLIDEIFVKFLFASIFQQDSQNSTDNLRIKPSNSRSSSSKKGGFGKKSKDAAYKLLNSLIKKSPLLMNSFLEKSMVPLMNLIRRHDGWNYSPPGLSEKQQKFVGLRNLGCICYLNSMLQQFFMIPAFRYNLLCVDDKISEDI
jgi:ubiquitin carboxyl-terminal hydrolase 34